MLSAGFRRPEQFLPRVQALVWDLASALPSSLDGSPPAWFVAVLWLGDGPAMRELAGCRLSARSRHHESAPRIAGSSQTLSLAEAVVEAGDLWHSVTMRSRTIPPLRGGRRSNIGRS